MTPARPASTVSGVRTLVTGGAGFIGSNLVDALLARGDEVAILDDLSTGRRVNIVNALEAGATLHEGSVADAGAVAAALEAARPEVIYHLAAQIDVRRAVEDPAFDATINVVGTATLLEAARQAGVRGVTILALTDSALSPLALLADAAFTVVAIGAGPFDSHVGTLALLNALLTGVADKLRTSATDRLDRIEEAWRTTGALIEP